MNVFASILPRARVEGLIFDQGNLTWRTYDQLGRTVQRGEVISYGSPLVHLDRNMPFDVDRELALRELEDCGIGLDGL